MATAATVSTTVTEIGTIADSILQEISAVDPAVAAPAAIVEMLAGLVTKAIAAYSAASGAPVTVASIEALLPNPEPLSAPITS